MVDRITDTHLIYGLLKIPRRPVLPPSPRPYAEQSFREKMARADALKAMRSPSKSNTTTTRR